MNLSRLDQGLFFSLLLLAGLLLQACSTTVKPPAPTEDQATTTRQHIDLIIEGDYIVSMDIDDSVYRNGAIAIDQGVIIAIGAADEIATRYTSENRLQGDNRVVMPGLVNGHSHAAMTLLRGVAEDLALVDWLNKYIFPAEVRFVDADFVRIGTELACWEMIRGGTTTFVDMYYYPDSIAEVVESCGMRAMISATVIDQTSPDADSAADSLAKGEAFIKRWQGRNSRISPMLGPHATYTLDATQLRAVRDTAIALNVPIAIHLSESPFEVEYAQQTYGMSSIELLDSLDFFDAPTVGAHVVWPLEKEIPMLVENSVGVIHNPTSNMKTAAGISPVTELLQAGVKVGLGTDGAASNNDLDMWEEIRLAAFLQKVHHMNPQVMPARTVLNMATQGGADAIGLGHTIGSLVVGKRADIIQLAFDDVHFVPTYDVIAHLVYVADEQDVASVVVDGKVLMRDKEILTIDTRRVKTEAQELAARIQEAIMH